jgi:hypothetical protein
METELARTGFFLKKMRAVEKWLARAREKVPNGPVRCRRRCVHAHPLPFRNRKRKRVVASCTPTRHESVQGEVGRGNGISLLTNRAMCRCKTASQQGPPQGYSISNGPETSPVTLNLRVALKISGGNFCRGLHQPTYSRPVNVGPVCRQERRPPTGVQPLQESPSPGFLPPSLFQDATTTSAPPPHGPHRWSFTEALHHAAATNGNPTRTSHFDRTANNAANGQEELPLVGDDVMF